MTRKRRLATLVELATRLNIPTDPALGCGSPLLRQRVAAAGS